MILSFLHSFYSVLKINIIIFYNKIFSPRKKIVLFYSPSKKQTQDIIYIESLFDNFEKDYLIFLCFNAINISHNKNYYIKYSFLKFIFKVDVFVSNLVCDVFTKNSIRIYIHHDIYDTPLVNAVKEREFSDRIVKYDFLFVSGKKNIKMFNNFFNKHVNTDVDEIPKVIEAGYTKLDYLRNAKLKKNLQSFNHIVIAPTDFYAFKELTLFEDLSKIIENLLNLTESKIIFRPHPSNRNISTTLEIREKFKDDKNFELDLSNNYLDTYLKSKCLITDLSGTAYTYAFLTKQPVIFFIKNQKMIRDLNYHQLSYFKDREKVGVVVNNPDEIAESVKKVEFIKKKIKVSNDNLEKEINYLGNSKNRIKELVNEILISKKR